MFPLFETIRYKNGVAENLALHQQRVDRSLLDLGGVKSLQLADWIQEPTPLPHHDNGIYKCRVQYNLTGTASVSFEPYFIRKIKTISVQEIGHFNYAYKFTNRDWINTILLKSGTDDVIFTQNGWVKDASYANLVFYDGTNWVTPSQPLLQGTRRVALLESGIITEAPIQIDDLKKFHSVKLINAMMLWEESPLIALHNI
ncbi:MAG: hypothetical protein RLZ56_1205 [Bacteroidota bacterium]|jgi:4-amino-4-deoxychorismate lyase